MVLSNGNNINDEAQQWYEVIAPIVSKEGNLTHGQQYEIMRTIASGKYEGLTLPYGKNRVSLRTIERKIAAYRKGGKDALKANIRERATRIPNDYLEEALKLKKENMSRSLERIISMLEESGRVPQNTLKRSTLYDYFTKKKLTRPTMGKITGKFTRYGASYRSEILQGDTHYTLKLQDPDNCNLQKQVYLFIWLDDYTRLANGQFYWKERLPSLEDSLKKWIILHGKPENAYTDNGAVYSSNHLKDICASLGIRLLHSRPYKPQGRGKCEKFFQIVENSFKSEVELLIRDKKLTTLTELNLLFSAWLNKYYNNRVHSATKQTPKQRWDSCEHPIQKPSLNTIYEAFLYKDERTASKTGIISIHGNEYEVEQFLCSKKVMVKYDPYDLTSGIQVYFDGIRFKDAIPAKIHRHSKKDYDKERMNTDLVPSTGLNFLEQLSQKELSKKELMKFVNIEKGSEAK
jgi:hypothetical protein